jgi:glycosyltransferase involved in cell wall biosynthesis
VTPEAHRFSVVIPTYNRRDDLQIAIGSVRAQTVPADQVEIVVVDNCSTDGTEELFETPEYKDVRYIRQGANLGRWRNMTSALAESTGRYVTMLFDDEVMEPDNLELKGLLLDRHPEAVAAHSNWFKRFDDGRREAIVPLSTRPFVENPRRLRFRTFRQVPGWIATLVIRGDIARQVGVLESDAPCDDDAFFLRLSTYGSLAYTPEALISQTYNEGDSLRTGYVDADAEVVLPGLWFAWAHRRIREEHLITNRSIPDAEVLALRLLGRMQYRREIWELAGMRRQAGLGWLGALRFFRRAVALDWWVVLPPLFYFAKKRAAVVYWRTRL